MDGSGHFSYLPTAGYTGDDTFTYEIKDGSNLTGTGTVTIHVNTQRVWDVQNDASGTTPGTSVNPFTTLASAQGVATAVGISSMVPPTTDAFHGPGSPVEAT